MSKWAHFGTLFFNAVFVDAFSDAIFGSLDVILEPLGTYFGSLLGPCSQFLPIYLIS